MRGQNKERGALQTYDHKLQWKMLPALMGSHMRRIGWMRSLCFFIVTATLCPAAASQVGYPAEFTGKVVAVKDGDTIEVLNDSAAVRVRLAHIDCPESGQPFGKAAKQKTSDLCFGKQARVVQQDKPDRYGRMIGVVHVGDTCVNMALVEAGMAWHFVKYSQDTLYSIAERKARFSGTGLWSDPGAISPWEWRRLGRGGQ